MPRGKENRYVTLTPLIIAASWENPHRPARLIGEYRANSLGRDKYWLLRRGRQLMTIWCMLCEENLYGEMQHSAGQSDIVAWSLRAV
jgi:hypothetical protein